MKRRATAMAAGKGKPQLPEISGTNKKLLEAVDEEGFVRMDVLARRLGRSVFHTRIVVGICVKHGYLSTESWYLGSQLILPNDSRAWVWILEAGRTAIGSNRPPVTRPRDSELTHRMALVAVRAFLTEEGSGCPTPRRSSALVRGLEFLSRKIAAWFAGRAGYELWSKLTLEDLRGPGGRWWTERDLMARQGLHQGDAIPDALRQKGGRRVAIMIELGRKAPSSIASQLGNFAAVWGEVFCFCSPATRKTVELTVRNLGLTHVQVFDLPEVWDDRPPRS